MLIEEKIYGKNKPYHFSLVNIIEYPLHYHFDIEIVYVIKGNLTIHRGFDNFLVKEGDVFVLNSREVHGFYGTGEKNRVFLLQINIQHFSALFPELHRSSYFSYGLPPEDHRLREMKHLLNNIMEASISSIEEDPVFVSYKIEDLIECLEVSFPYFSYANGRITSGNHDNPVFGDRLREMISYIYENHKNKITLDEIAEIQHVSRFYLSHMIKQVAGMSFREFLSFARIDISLIPLLGTTKSICEIAMEVGFSDVRYYNKWFEQWFGQSPQEYRDTYSSMIISDSHGIRMEDLLSKGDQSNGNDFSSMIFDKKPRKNSRELEGLSDMEKAEWTFLMAQVSNFLKRKGYENFEWNITELK